MIDTIQLKPEQPFLDARHFEQLIDFWLTDMALRVAQRTFDDYKDKIRYVREWWVMKGPAYNWSMSEPALLDFAQWLANKESRFGSPLAYNTRRDAHRRVRQLFIWAWKKGYVQNNYAKWVPAPEGSAPLRKAPPLQDLRKLIEAAGHSTIYRLTLRNRAILAVLLGTGVRRSECAGINVEDVQIGTDNSGIITVKAKKVKAREIHSRHVAFDPATGVYIKNWVEELDPSGPLWPSERFDEPRLTPVGIYRVVKKIIHDAGLDRQIQGPHDLRRYFATYYSRNRKGEAHGQLLSKQLGHSTYRMTAHYSLQDVEDIRESIISPFALLNKEDGK